MFQWNKGSLKLGWQYEGSKAFFNSVFPVTCCVNDSIAPSLDVRSVVVANKLLRARREPRVTYNFCVSCPSQTGTCLWSTGPGEGSICTKACVTGGPPRSLVLVGSLDGACSCVFEDDGSPAWNRKLASPVFSSPVLVQSGTAVLFTEVLGVVHCFAAVSGVEVNETFTQMSKLSCRRSWAAEFALQGYKNIFYKIGRVYWNFLKTFQCNIDLPCSPSTFKSLF